MYVMIDDMAVPLSSGMYFTLLSQGAFTPLSGAGVLPPTGGNLMMLFIGAAALIVVLAFLCAMLASRMLNRRAHPSMDSDAGNDQDGGNQGRKSHKHTLRRLAAGVATVLILLQFAPSMTMAEGEQVQAAPLLEEDAATVEDENAPVQLEGTNEMLYSAPIEVNPEGKQELQSIQPPTKISFKRIGKKSKIELIGFDENGRIKMPDTAEVVGLSMIGSYPGYPGNSLIMGHNNFHGKIGLFTYLTRLKLDDIIIVTNAEGAELNFKVASIDIYPFDGVPDSVLDMTGDSRITMISCCGGFDTKIGTSRNRCVVVAVPTQEE